MCGRYQVMDEEVNIEMKKIIDEINRRHYGKEEEKKMATGEIFPTNIAPVISTDGPKPMRWGFPPVRNGLRAVINARQETAATSPYFRDALQRRRVVVPTSGFFEWNHDEKKKATDKYRFRLPGESVLYLAGIYSPFALEGNTVEESYSILTTAANDGMIKTCNHDRMPVYLSVSEVETWLHDPKCIEDILRRPQPPLEAIVVKKHNRPTHEQTSMFH